MNKDPIILPKKKRSIPGTKIIDANTDIPESSPSVYFKLAKIKWIKEYKIIRQINESVPENYEPRQLCVNVLHI